MVGWAEISPIAISFGVGQKPTPFIFLKKFAIIYIEKIKKGSKAAMDNYPNYEFYVLNYDCNARKVINFNIFQNWQVAVNVNEAVEKYSRNEMKVEELREEIRRIIAWQEWGRREYEISVGDAFETNCDKLEKWDCYAQALPNINLITDMCIKKYLEWKGEK